MDSFKISRNYLFIILSLMLFGSINSAKAQSYSISGNIADFTTDLPVENATITISDPITNEVYDSTIYSDAQGNYETVITLGVNSVPYGITHSQNDFVVTSTFPNPVQLNTDLNVYYNCPDNRVLDPVVELFDFKGSLIEANTELAAGLYTFRLSFENGVKSNSQKLIIPEGGYLDFNLIKNNNLNKVAHTKSTSSLLDVLITVEKTGYIFIAEEKTLSSESINTFDFKLTGLESVLTPAQRITVLDSIESKLNQLIDVDFELANQLMLEYLLSLDEIQDATLTESGSFWASFTDGKIICISSSRYPLEDDALTKAASIHTAEYTTNSTDSKNYIRSSKSDNVTVTASGLLPSSKNFRLLNGIGTYYDNTNPIPKLRSMLLSKGYTDAGGDATLESLRHVSGDGIFYFRSHAEEGPAASGLEIYGVWTESPVDEDAELENAALKDDLENSRIIYMFFRTAGYQQFKSLYSHHYGITHLFVKRYMSFAPNALVYIDACNSSTLSFFRQSFTGASLFIGWSERVLYTKIQSTSQYVFDRLLGANMFDIPSPPQRPFEFSSLSSDPAFGPNKKYGYSQKGTIIANLGFFPLKDDFAMLAPSIKNLEIDEVNETMEINGKFGPDPGEGNRTVLIGGRNVPPNPWADDKISIELKPEDKGDVVVKINDIESNKVPLTSWEGEFIYTYKLLGPSLTQKVNCNIHFRGDVHPYRDLPGNPLQYVNTNIIAARDSKGTWEFSGRDDAGDGCTFTEMTGAASLQWSEPGNASDWNGGDCKKSAQFKLRGTIDPNLGTLNCNLVLWACGKFNYAVKLNESCNLYSRDEPLFVHPEYLLAPIVLDMDDNFNIASSNRGELNAIQEVKLEWKNFVTTASPDEKTPSK